MTAIDPNDIQDARRATPGTAVHLALALVLVAEVLCPRTCRAQEADDELREQALEIYVDRCGVEPGSARERYAASDWEYLVGAGYLPDVIHALAARLPEDCSYIAFKGAILAMEREANTPKRVPAAAPEPDEVEADAEPDPIEDTRRALRPMVGVGWVMSGIGMTLLGVGTAGILGDDYGAWSNVVGTIGGQLFMTSLMITTIAGSVIYAGDYGHLGVRSLRHAANGMLVAGGVALIVDLAMMMAVMGAFFDALGGGSGSGAPSAELANGIAIFALVALVSSSIMGQVANTELLRDLDRIHETRGSRSRSPGVRWGVVPTVTQGGGGAVLVGRW